MDTAELMTVAIAKTRYSIDILSVADWCDSNQALKMKRVLLQKHHVSFGWLLRKDSER